MRFGKGNKQSKGKYSGLTQSVAPAGSYDADEYQADQIATDALRNTSSHSAAKSAAKMHLKNARTAATDAAQRSADQHIGG